jgi:hypothetical protein
MCWIDKTLETWVRSFRSPIARSGASIRINIESSSVPSRTPWALYRGLTASLEIDMAKGQKRSNRELKKPKKKATESAKTNAAPTLGSLGKKR